MLLLPQELPVHVGVLEAEQDVGILEISAILHAGHAKVEPSLIAYIRAGITVTVKLNDQCQLALVEAVAYEVYLFNVAAGELAADSDGLVAELILVVRPLVLVPGDI